MQDKKLSFDKRYHLGTIDKKTFRFVSKSEAKYLNAELVGKPKNNFIETWKRFFTNPYAAFALFVFIFILLMSIIVTQTAVFDPIQKVHFREFNAAGTIVNNLPPSYAPEVTRFVSTTSPLLRQLGAARDFSANTANPFTFTIVPVGAGALATFDAYQFYNISSQISAQTTGGQAVVLSTLLGTTSQGADIWTRTWAGTLEAIGLGILVTITEVIIGVLIGAYVGFHAGKALDTLFLRLVEIFAAIPSLIWFVILVAIFGSGFWTLFLILTTLGWVGPMYITRNFIILVKDAEYITASKSIGASKLRQIFSHALPAILGKLVGRFVIRIPNVVFSISALAFLRLIDTTNTFNLGVILNNARETINVNFWGILLPSMILLSMSLSLQFVALGLHDALDPRIIRGKK